MLDQLPGLPSKIWPFFLACGLLITIYFISSAAFVFVDKISSLMIRNRFTELELAIYLYHERYQILPGDDNLRPERGGDWSFYLHAPLFSGNANGIIENNDTSSSETLLVWAHLRSSELISGTPADTTPPSLFPNIQFSVKSMKLDNQQGTFICASNLNRRIASYIIDVPDPYRFKIQSMQIIEENIPPNIFSSWNNLNPDGITICYRMFWHF